MVSTSNRSPTSQPVNTPYVLFCWRCFISSLYFVRHFSESIEFSSFCFCDLFFHRSFVFSQINKRLDWTRCDAVDKKLKNIVLEEAKRLQRALTCHECIQLIKTRFNDYMPKLPRVISAEKDPAYLSVSEGITLYQSYSPSFAS
jgi:hypothetical protein